MIDLNELSYEELQKLAHDANKAYWAKRIAKENTEGTARATYNRIVALEPVILDYYDTPTTMGEAIVKVLDGFVIMDIYVDWEDTVGMIKEIFEIDLEDLEKRLL